MILESAAVLADHRGDGDGIFFFPFFLLLILGITAAVLLWRRRRGPSGSGAPSARSVLDERFARGDIDRAEYEHRKAVLAGEDDVPPAPPRTSTAVADPPGEPPTGPAVDDER